MWIAKKDFGKYKKGDEVKEEDAKRVGSLYCAKNGNAVENAGNTSELTQPETENKPDPENIVNTDAPAPDAETEPKPKKKK